MHRTIGDSYGLDGSKRIFRQENSPSWLATQVTYDSMNALQEEVANVITAEGFALLTSAETIAQMVQLNTAINKKVSDEATARNAAIVARTPNSDLRSTVGTEVFETDQGVLAGVTGFRANLQRFATPNIIMASVTFEFPVSNLDHKWVTWELPPSWKPILNDPQNNVVLPATAILKDMSASPIQIAQTPMYVGVQKLTTPAPDVWVVMFSGPELADQNADTYPTQIALPKPATGTGDKWVVSGHVMYPG
jgi:hypothetical protein